MLKTYHELNLPPPEGQYIGRNPLGKIIFEPRSGRHIGQKMQIILKKNK